MHINAERLSCGEETARLPMGLQHVAPQTPPPKSKHKAHVSIVFQPASLVLDFVLWYAQWYGKPAHFFPPMRICSVEPKRKKLSTLKLEAFCLYGLRGNLCSRGILV